MNHIGREVLLASCILADPQGEFFLGGCAQAKTFQSYPIRACSVLILMRTQQRVISRQISIINGLCQETGPIDVFRC